MPRVDAPRSNRELARWPVVFLVLILSFAGCSAPASPAAFTVGDLTVASDAGEILPGDGVTITAEITNTGDLDGTYEAELSVDGAVQGHQAVTITAGESEPVQFDWTAGLPGDHPVGIGSSTGTVHVGAAAVFVVSDLHLASGPAEVLTGDAAEVISDVTNAGTIAGTAEITFSVDGSEQARQPVDLEVGERTTLRFPFTAGTPGDHRIEVGGATTIVTVLGPASVSVTGLTLSPNPIEKGGKLGATVTVENQGDATGTIVVKVKIGDKTAAKQEVTVAGRETTTVEIPLAAPAPGKHTVSVGEQSERLVVWKITRPANAKVLTNKIKGGRGQLTIENGNDRDAVLVLARKASPKKAVLVVYVRAGKDATVKGIKDGTYVVYYTIGDRWDSKSRAFTSDVERSRFEDPIRFKTRRTSTMITWSVWTLTLNAVFGGNAPTEGVDPGDFPGIP